MSAPQLTAFIHQLSSWPEARDPEGRTALMAALSCTRGRTPELFLDPKARECLEAMDGTGRNLWSYAYHFRNTFNIASVEWRDVMERVPRQFNPSTGRGLFTDHLLNPSGFTANEQRRYRRNPHEVWDIESFARNASHPGMATLGGVADWIGPGKDLWWRCRDRDEEGLFEALCQRSDWSKWHRVFKLRSVQVLDNFVSCTLAEGEQSEDLPEPYRAFFCVLKLMVSNDPQTIDANLHLVEEGLLDRFVATHWNAFERHVRAGDEALTSLNPARARLGASEWLSRLKQRRFDQEWAQPEPIKPPRPRL